MILSLNDLCALVEEAGVAAEVTPCRRGSDEERVVMCLRSAWAALQEAVAMERRIKEKHAAQPKEEEQA